MWPDLAVFVISHMCQARKEENIGKENVLLKKSKINSRKEI